MITFHSIEFPTKNQKLDREEILVRHTAERGFFRHYLLYYYEGSRGIIVNFPADGMLFYLFGSFKNDPLPMV